MYDPDVPLSWDDFDPTPFCLLFYDPNDPTAEERIISRVGDAEFDTYCTIPSSKQGRHVIYAEWGRNEWTFERFHGCIDVVLVGGSPTTPQPISPTESVAPTNSPVVPTYAPVAPTDPPVAPVTASPAGPSPTGIPYPCCGWNGDCEQPENTFCHSTCERCTGDCNGMFYTGPGVGSTSCDAPAPSPPSSPTDPPATEGCCTWGGWSTCPSWTETSTDPVSMTSIVSRADC